MSTGKSPSFFFLILVLYSLLWFFWPWSQLVALFVAGLVFLWVLFFASFLALSRGLVLAAGLAALPLAAAPLAEPLFIWYAVSPLVFFGLIVYAASRIYGWLWGLVFVIGSLWLHVAMLMVLDWVSGGFVQAAFRIGFDVYVRWNVFLVAALDSSALYVSCVVMRRLLRRRVA